MARIYLVAGLVCVFAYAGFALFGAEFGSATLTKESPSQAAARAAAAAARRSSGGYYGGGGGFGGGK